MLQDKERDQMGTVIRAQHSGKSENADFELPDQLSRVLTSARCNVWNHIPVVLSRSSVSRSFLIARECSCAP